MKPFQSNTYYLVGYIYIYMYPTYLTLVTFFSRQVTLAQHSTAQV